MPGTLKSETRRLASYHAVKSLPAIWPLAVQRFTDTIALHDPHAIPEVRLSFSDLYYKIQQFAAGLQTLGVKAGDRIALFADDSPRWFIADQGIMTAGAVSVVRGAQSGSEELQFILQDSQAIGLVLEDAKILAKLGPALSDFPLQFVLLLSDETPDQSNGLPLVGFSHHLSTGDEQTVVPNVQDRKTLATLMYTSGTTGKPKGVMLTHGNLLHQIEALTAILQPHAGDRTLAILPTWHIYGRSCEYYLLSQGCTLTYSTIRHFKQDLNTFTPHYLIVVPRLLEALYDGVQQKLQLQPTWRRRLAQGLLGLGQRYIMARRTAAGLNLENLRPARQPNQIQTTLLRLLHALGDRLVFRQIRAALGGNLKLAVSGGASLASYLDTFYETIGIEVLVGYGLTETSPVLTVRRPSHNLRGSSGQPLVDTEIRIVDPETRQALPQGERGLVLARGPQVMAGYYNNPTATAQVLDGAGWFNTGDLGWVTGTGDLVLVGRAKDTIVLTNGENIEPQPLEGACLCSPFINQIMLVGQDQRSLGALIFPNLEMLQTWALEQNYRLELPDNVPPLPQVATSTKPLTLLSLESQPIRDLLRQELSRQITNRPGYRIDERIGPFQLIPEPFSIENGLLTRTLKVRRSVVMERYCDMINAMFL